MSLPRVARIRFVPKFRDYKADLDNTVVKRAMVLIALCQGSSSSSASKATSGKDSDLTLQQSGDHKTLFEGISRLRGSTTHIDNSIRIAMETEDLSTEVIRALDIQREQLENSKNRVCHSFQGLIVYLTT